MPVTPYKSSLNPYARYAAQDAFDLAWPEIDATGGYIQLARYLLAERIVEAAMFGERDPERLKAYALEGVRPSLLALDRRLPISVRPQPRLDGRSPRPFTIIFAAMVILGSFNARGSIRR